MADVTRAQVEGAICSYQDPYLKQDLVSLGAVKDIRIDGAKVAVDIVLGYPAAGLRGGLEQVLQTAVENIDGVAEAQVSVSWEVAAQQAQANLPNMQGVKNIIAVASGKGGVGKSTVTTNLALAMAQEGARVGVLDADIYGPSQALMLGVAEGKRPGVKDEKYFVPIEAHGVQVMSMAFMVDDKTPMVWRGPMVSGAFQQLLNQSLWDDLDYLFIDMPPGTGDIQLTLAQRVPVSGSVIVTTPQDIALLDAKKGIEMFRKVNVPVLGVVENMSLHTCSQCGHTEHVFGEGGGQRIAEQYETELLGALPLSLSIREQADSGQPIVAAEPENEAALTFHDMARRVGASLAARSLQGGGAGPSISMVDD